MTADLRAELAAAKEALRQTTRAQAVEIGRLREALTTIAFQSTDMPGAVGAGDGFYRGYVFDMIGTAARALSGDTDHDHR